MKKRGGQRKPVEEKSENRTVGLPHKTWAQVDKMPGTLAGLLPMQPLMPGTPTVMPSAWQV